MASEVTIGGKKFPKWEVWAVAVGGVVAVYFVMKARSNSNSSSSTTGSNSGVDPVTGLPYTEDNTVDPLTGITYLTEAQEYGSVQAAESAIQSAYSSSSASAGYGTGYYGSEVPYSYTSGTETGTNYTSNAQWAQAVEAGLTDIGYAPTDISGALGRYLAGLSLTSDQASIVQAGIAEYGPPPVGSFQVILAPSTSPTPTPTAQVIVPSVVGGSLGQAFNILQASGLKLTYAGAVSKDPSFDKVTSQSPAAGTKVNPGSPVTVAYVAQKTAITGGPE